MSLFKAFVRDVQAGAGAGPCGGNWVEVLLVYPGVHALFWHRVPTRYGAETAFWRLASSHMPTDFSQVLKSIRRLSSDRQRHRPRHGRRHRGDG